MMKKLFERILKENETDTENEHCACCGGPDDGVTVEEMLDMEDDSYWSSIGHERFLNKSGLDKDALICRDCYEREMEKIFYD